MMRLASAGNKLSSVVLGLTLLVGAGVGIKRTFPLDLRANQDAVQGGGALSLGAENQNYDLSQASIRSPIAPGDVKSAEQVNSVGGDYSQQTLQAKEELKGTLTQRCGARWSDDTLTAIDVQSAGSTVSSAVQEFEFVNQPINGKLYFGLNITTAHGSFSIRWRGGGLVATTQSGRSGTSVFVK